MREERGAGNGAPQIRRGLRLMPSRPINRGFKPREGDGPVILAARPSRARTGEGNRTPRARAHARVWRLAQFTCERPMCVLLLFTLPQRRSDVQFFRSFPPGTPATSSTGSSCPTAPSVSLPSSTSACTSLTGSGRGRRNAHSLRLSQARKRRGRGWERAAPPDRTALPWTRSRLNRRTVSVSVQARRRAEQLSALSP